MRIVCRDGLTCGGIDCCLVKGDPCLPPVESVIGEVPGCGASIVRRESGCSWLEGETREPPVFNFGRSSLSKYLST